MCKAPFPYEIECLDTPLGSEHWMYLVTKPLAQYYKLSTSAKSFDCEGK